MTSESILSAELNINAEILLFQFWFGCYYFHIFHYGCICAWVTAEFPSVTCTKAKHCLVNLIRWIIIRQSKSAIWRTVLQLLTNTSSHTSSSMNLILELLYICYPRSTVIEQNAVNHMSLVVCEWIYCPVVTILQKVTGANFHAYETFQQVVKFLQDTVTEGVRYLYP